MLPVFASSESFAFRAQLNGKYLQSVYGNQAAGSRVEPSASTVAGSTRTGFLVEWLEGEEGLMHVRCCYNNKYLVPVQAQDSGSSRWIIGTADEPEKDLSKPSSCTLFRAIPVKDNCIRFLHPGLQKFACVVSISDKTYLELGDFFDNDLRLDYEDDQENSDNFIVVGLSRLPKHVAFKGDNGNYLGIPPLWDTSLLSPLGSTVGVLIRVANRGFLQFHTRDIRDASVIFTTFTNADGAVRIKSNNGKSWRRTSNDYILTQLVQDENDPDSLFEVVTRDGFVTFRNLGNNKFCKGRLGPDLDFRFLIACDGSISQWAKLKLEVPVVRSEISNVKFHLDEARVYNKMILNVVPDIRTNDTSRELKATFSFTKKLERVSTWETNVSSKIGRTAKITYGSSGTPIVVGGEGTISTESTTSEKWTTSESNTEETTLTQEYYIPPWTTVAAKFVSTRASCDVPYSYKQTDVLTTGEEISTDYHDGIYTVSNNYGFQITVTEQRRDQEGRGIVLLSTLVALLCLFSMFFWK